MTINEIITLISSLVALVGAATGIAIARSTRRKNEGDAALAITEAAEKIVVIREKDAKLKEEQIQNLCDKVSKLEQYVDYLHDWIETRLDGKTKPETFKEFLLRKGQKNEENLPCN